MGLCGMMRPVGTHVMIIVVRQVDSHKVASLPEIRTTGSLAVLVLGARCCFHLSLPAFPSLADESASSDDTML